MKKITFAGLIFVTMLAASCKKTTTGSSETATFKGVTYNYATCTYTTGSLEALSPSPTYSLSIGFYSGGPGTAGTYIVNANGPDTANQVSVVLVTNTGVTYNGTSGNGTSQKVNVTISSGKVGASASNIYLVNGSNPSDSALVTFNINQQ